MVTIWDYCALTTDQTQYRSMLTHTVLQILTHQNS